MTVTVEDVVAHLRKRRRERAEAAAARQRELESRLPEARRLLTEELGA